MPNFKKIIRTLPGNKKAKQLYNIFIKKTKTKSKSCTLCRLNDSALSFEKMISEILIVIQKKEIPYIEYRESTGLHHIYLPLQFLTELKTLIKELTQKDNYAIKHREVILSENKYEVDGVLLKFPTQTEKWTIYRKCKCGKSNNFQQNWSVQLSLYSDFQEARFIHLRNNLVRVLPPHQNLPEKLNKLWATAKKEASGIEPLHMETVNFPVDIVYTWVNDEDPEWQKKKANYTAENYEDEKYQYINSHEKNKPKSADNQSRFRNRDELLYSLRSVYMYAPFVRKIFILTDNQTPSWLDTDNEKVKLVFHHDVFDKDTTYPVFSSRPIEFNLHNIPDLSEHFVYMNDDFFFSSPINPTDFFYYNGTAKIFPTKRLLDSRDIQKTDRATVASHKNSTNAFQKNFGTSPTGKFKHSPYSVRRSACFEAEKVFSEQIKISKNNRFRSWDDVTWSFVLPHYMLYKAFGVPAGIKSRYIDVNDDNLPFALLNSEKDKELKTLCINDTDSDHESQNEIFLKDWMKTRFPVKAPWEKGS